MIEPTNYNLFRFRSQHVRDPRTQPLRLSRMRPYSYTVIITNVGYSDERADWRVPHIRLFVGRRNCFRSFRQRGGYVGHFSAALRGCVPFISAKSFREGLATRQPSPVGPLRSGGHGARRANGFPLVGRNDGDEIALLHNFGGWKLFLVHSTNGDQGRT